MHRLVARSIYEEFSIYITVMAVSFTQGYLRYLMRRQDVQEYNLGSNIDSIFLERLTAAREMLNAANYSVEISRPFRPSATSKDLLFKPSRFEDKLYIRHLNRRLTAAYNVRHTNRNDVVRQVRELMRADTHLRIVRTDIRRFFCSVNFEVILEQLRADGFLTSAEIDAIAKIAEFTANFQMKGIPWGLSISSTLAEMYLLKFDHRKDCVRFGGVIEITSRSNRERC